MIFNKIVSLTGGPVEYERTRSGHLKLKNHDYPWSIVEREFTFLFETIVNNKLTRGYEACTGVGISGLAAALGMKQTGGKIVSLDAYVEERLNNYNYDDQKILLENADGYKSVFYLRDEFDVKDQFFPEVGWTPDDVGTIIERHYTEPLDYVFIDGGHKPDQLLLDIKAVIPYTNESTIWTFHDCNPSLWSDGIANFCREHLSAELQIVCPSSEGCNDLGILIRK
jgi:hypothetical protein